MKAKICPVCNRGFVISRSDRSTSCSRYPECDGQESVYYDWNVDPEEDADEAWAMGLDIGSIGDRD